MKFDTSLAWNNMFGGGFGFLVNQARNAFLNDMEGELAPLNITSSQFMVVVGIAHERARTLTEFSHFLGYDSGAMKRLLDRIEDKGVIIRRRCDTDRRLQILELTEAGKELYPRIMEVARRVHAKTLEGFTPEEAALFQTFLQKVIASSGR